MTEDSAETVAIAANVVDVSTERNQKAPPPLEVRPEHFINRELSWLAFNERVLEEADNPNHPLLERLRFLSISDNNLDEFYMVRVSGLMEVARLPIPPVGPDGMTPMDALQAIKQRVGAVTQVQQRCWHELTALLRDQGVAVLDVGELSKGDLEFLRQRFDEEAIGVSTAIASSSKRWRRNSRSPLDSSPTSRTATP